MELWRITEALEEQNKLRCYAVGYSFVTA